MRDQGRTAGLEGRLLALLQQEEQEERQARWRSLPAEARRAAVEQLARMMLLFVTLFGTKMGCFCQTG